MVRPRCNQCTDRKQFVFIRHRRLLPQQTAMPNEDVAHACRGRDGSGCGLFGANRQVTGELHAQEDMAAKNMTMSMAAVLREWINVRARLSPVLGLMIDESTEITRCCFFISAFL